LPREDEVGVWDDCVNYLLGVWNKEAISNCEGTTFEKRKMRALVSRSRGIEATVWVGKEGASEALISQIGNQLKTREIVKVKMHRSALQHGETNDLATKIAASTSSKLIEIIGHTFTLYKKRVNPVPQKKTKTY
jgi:putative YhbY family RNA-binding protein